MNNKTRVRVIEPFGTHQIGNVLTVPADKAEAWIKAGKVARLDSGKPPAKPANKGKPKKDKAAVAGPKPAEPDTHTPAPADAD